MKVFPLTLVSILISLSGFSQDYFPQAKGNVWNFKLTLDEQEYDYKWEIEDTTTVNGTVYFNSKIVIPGLLEEPLVSFNKSTDQNVILTKDSINASSTEILFLHDPTNDTIIINGTDTADIAYFGEVTVPAGTFQNVYTSINRSDSLTTLFFAPDVGYIRQDSEGETILVLETYNVGMVTSTNQIHNSSFKIYPNPTSGIIQIQNQEVFDSMIIRDISGKEVLNTLFSNQIDVSNFNKGIYFLSISNSNSTQTSSFVVK